MYFFTRVVFPWLWVMESKTKEFNCTVLGSTLIGIATSVVELEDTLRGVGDTRTNKSLRGDNPFGRLKEELLKEKKINLSYLQILLQIKANGQKARARGDILILGERRAEMWEVEPG